MFRLTLLAVVFGAFAACGGDDDGSGVDSDKTLDQATVEDAMALCEYIEALFDPDDSKKVSCYVSGLFAAEQGGDCQMVTDDCLAEPTEVGDFECADIDQDDVSDLPACASMVTFGEYEECVGAQGASYAELADEVSCDSDLEALLEMELPEACTAIQEECPELFGDEGGGV